MKRFYSTFLFLALFPLIGNSQLFQEITTDLEGVMLPACAWISPGEDENLLVFLSGENYIGNQHTVLSQLNSLYSNERFIHIPTKLPAVYRGAAAVADFDNDNDDDIIITGLTENNHMIMKLFRNEGRNHFTDKPEMVTPLTDGSLEWGDYDNDGDLDILATGKMFNQNLATIIYRNDNGIFTEIETNVPGIQTEMLPGAILITIITLTFL